MILTKKIGRTLSMIATLALLCVSQSGYSADRATLRSDGKWRRMVARDRTDISIRLKEGTGGRFNGKLILGTSGKISGDPAVLKGGADRRLLEIALEAPRNPASDHKMVLEAAKKRNAPGIPTDRSIWERVVDKVLWGTSMRNEWREYPHYRVEIGFYGAIAGGINIGELPVKSVTLKQKAGRLGRWKTVMIKRGDQLKSASPEVDKTPIAGDAAKEICDLLEEAGAPYVDLDGANYRGLEALPYNGAPGHFNYEIRFDQIEVPAQLNSALNGLRSNGLRADHPIFDRVKD